MFRGSFFYYFVANSVRNFFLFQPVNTDKPHFVSFLVFVGAAASFTAKIHLLKLSRNEKPIEIPSQNSEYPRIFWVREANQNARKLLSTDLVNTTNKYNADRKYESERHYSNTTHIAIIIICALEFSCKFDTEPVNRKGRQTQNVSLLNHKLTLSFSSFLC